MTSQSPRIYIYKITFEEVPYYYYGVKKEKYFNEEYWGSPVTNKWCWELYTPKKQILEIFDYTNEGWIEANFIEDRIIRNFFNTDKWCLNESCGGVISLKIMKENGKECSKMKLGIHSLSKEERTENGKIGGSIGGKISYENKLGFHSLTKDERKKYNKIGGDKCYENGSGIHSLPKEKRVEYSRKGGLVGGKKGGKIAGKITGNQKWKCTETGYIANPGNLTIYQIKRGIDTSKRERIE
jgi:hypothetical protein